MSPDGPQQVVILVTYVFDPKRKETIFNHRSATTQPMRNDDVCVPPSVEMACCSADLSRCSYRTNMWEENASSILRLTEVKYLVVHLRFHITSKNALHLKENCF